jgi:hypothetical protein
MVVMGVAPVITPVGPPGGSRVDAADTEAAPPRGHALPVDREVATIQQADLGTGRVIGRPNLQA